MKTLFSAPVDAWGLLVECPSAGSTTGHSRWHTHSTPELREDVVLSRGGHELPRRPDIAFKVKA
ncbi:hypothetical protein OG413_28340 [Streptomyces sp. NBC_01433]|uniref:hypothetical protein n=1 Tax=Streptomyces sp. NBC_01433 TaxID=2903864 RepID=UPI00225975FC|nr:hypothetical protein [Streptomyces sp. NBC_01433]MCX4679168.1 hypothetical protein [Streptomyces sp. NBC_01433]